MGGLLTGIVLAGLVGCGAYIYYLNVLVTHRFEGLRWTLPAHVYAAPMDLYAGLQLSGPQLEHELQRLSYHQVPELDQPGTYRVTGDRIDVALRAVEFADGSRPATVLSVTFGPTGIQDLRDSTGREVPVTRLDPLLIGSLFPVDGVDRIVVTPQEVPPLLPAALKAVEDRTFDTNRGVDPLAILRALWVDLRSHRIEEGGSTLTQQLVKSYFLTNRQTLGRKVREAVMAVSLATHFSKDDLMNAYINEIFLGQDGNRSIHGFGLASEFYFGKPLSELDLPQVATLVAIVRGPTYYDPRSHAQRTLARRNLVLQILAQQGVIKPDQAQIAQGQPLGVTVGASGAYYPAYLDLVRRTLQTDYPQKELTEAGLRVYTSLDPRVQEEAERSLDAELLVLDKRHRRHRVNEKLEGAVVVTSPQSGDVQAIVGGRNVDFDGFNRALDANRSIGSLIKPFIYLTALETGRYNAATVIQDQPVNIRLANGRYWRPENFTRRNYGPVPVVFALAESLNDATVGVGMDIGLEKISATLQRFGLQKAPDQVPAMLLGSIDIPPLEVAQLYNGIADGGFRTPLRAVRAVVSADGKPLKAYPLQVTQVAPSAQVYQVESMMEQVMTHGTGAPALSVLPPGLVTAGKSGTSSQDRDSWFAGFSGGQLAVVWVGYDHYEPTGLTGSEGALPVWDHLMASIGTTPLALPPPEGVTDTWIDYQTGMGAQPGCPGAVPVQVGLPTGTQVPPMPGCAAGTTAGTTLFQRAGQLLHRLVH
ncbi:MAG TPA: penicillin-binding protein 1B [Steroidobacteraceae bacterium]|nr:penicillin-binding protein 1B [Steroidobacteraceae bacterium]